MMAAGTNVSLLWSNLAGRAAYGAVGHRDVLIIVSEDGLPEPDVVRRRPAIELTEEVRRKLENQGIPREDQCDDLSIVKARYGLDKKYSISSLQRRGEGLTKECVVRKINTVMRKNRNIDGGNYFN